jgi:hypothetical protein
MIRFYFLLVVLILINCGTPISPREGCMERNRCDTKEEECYLQNISIYRAASGVDSISTEDGAVLFGTCAGLGDICKKNCMSSTLF